MGSKTSKKEKLIKSILEYQLDKKYPGVLPSELNGSEYYWDETGAKLVAEPDNIVVKARMYRIREGSRLKGHNLDDLKKLRQRLATQRYVQKRHNILREEQLFFNRPEARANYAFWGVAPYWTTEEAAALSFGKEPKRVNGQIIRSLPGELSVFIGEYIRRLELVSRAVEVGQLSDPITPRAFARWAKKISIEIPDELRDQVSSTGLTQQSAREMERISLLKIILGMAIAKYEYKPGADRNTATGKNRGSITSDLQIQGLDLDPDTIRGYLKKAVEEFGDLI